MERKLLLLGLLRMQDMHGYQLNDIIDSHLGSSVHLTKPTAYRLLGQMTDDGWITHREEQEGNRPTRRVYAITSEGEAAFQRLLRESLSSYKPAEFQSDISLAFLDLIPVEEALSLLQQRRSIIEELLQTFQTHGEHHGGFHLMIDHRIRHLSTELEWLDEIIAQIKA
jgi:DNA-binding PadR family transcriptional regulator